MQDSLCEFELIKHFFSNISNNNFPSNASLNLSIGDDCALFSQINNKQSWAISKDLLIENTHFFSDVTPYNLGYKSLAVNLSDLAAMGATPYFFLLGVALPNNNYNWIQQFTAGILDIAKKYNCNLIGGDTTKSSKHIVISITVLGQVDLEKSLLRSKANINDEIWVSNTLGDARLALGHKYNQWLLDNESLNYCIKKLELPTPRIELGQKLLGIANACLDLSDGLTGDLQHILQQSNVSAKLYIDKIPQSDYLKKQNKHIQNLCTLSGGDDYELCFTACTNKHQEILNLAKSLKTNLTCIGKIIDNQGLNNKLYIYDKQILIENYENLYSSFNHFK